MGDLSLSNKICVCVCVTLVCYPYKSKLKNCFASDSFQEEYIPDAGYHEDDNENEDREFQ